MLSAAFWLIVGLFIGWNFPQPGFAKAFQDKYIVPAINWVKTRIKL